MTEYWYSTEYSRAKCRHGMVKGIPCEACMAEPKTDAQHLTDFVGNATFADGQPVAPRVTATDQPVFKAPDPIDALKAALTNLVYEVTHLSPRNDDGSHNCRISAGALQLARDALNANPHR